MDLYMDQAKLVYIFPILSASKTFGVVLFTNGILLDLNLHDNNTSKLNEHIN